jgi:hypothetical protein
MATFNSPPGWPAPPTPDWQPPPGWQPDPSWPPAPPGWAFWLNARGQRARGPNGRYGAEPPVKLVAGWLAGGVAFLLIVAAIGGSGSSNAASSVPGPRVTTTVTTAVPGPTVTVAGPTATRTVTVPGPTATITAVPPRVTVTAKVPRATTAHTGPVPSVQSTTTTEPGKTSVSYANCSEVRAAGKAPLYEGQPGYAAHLDRDHDGVACE